MKKLLFFKILIIALVCSMLNNCASNETNSAFVNEKKVEYAFYNPKVNTFNNEERKIVFNSDLLKTEEMNFIKNGIVKDLLGKSFNQLEGISVYYDNAILNQHVKFNDYNILGIIIYELDNGGLMRHHFFVKNTQNKYEQKLSLLESRMSTTSQVFLVYKFFPEIYKTSTIGISTLSNVNLDCLKVSKQKNEFDLFRAANTFQNIQLNNTVYRTDDEDNFFRGVACMSCEEGGNGICVANRYCDPVDGGGNPDETITDPDDGAICDEKQGRYTAFSEGILTKTVAESLFDLALHRRLRDNLMVHYNIGEKYIEYYYAIAGFLQKEDYQLQTLYKIIATLPNFNSSVEKLLDQNYNGSDIIITESLKNDMFSIIADLKTVSNNADFQYILNDLENDLNAIKNKTKEQLLDELH